MHGSRPAARGRASGPSCALVRAVEPSLPFLDLGGLAGRRPVGDTRSQCTATTRFGEVDVGAPSAARHADDWGACGGLSLHDSEELELGGVKSDADGGVARGPRGCASTGSVFRHSPIFDASAVVCAAHSVVI